MNYTVENYLNHNWITIKNDSNLEIVFCSCGASIYSMHFDNEPVILEFLNKEDFLTSNGYHGKTLGRVAGRVTSPLEIDNKLYDLKLEKGFNYSLHAGSDTSISYKDFKYEVKEFDNKIKVIFKYTSKNLENGFPGKVKVKITYEINRYKDEIKLIQEAKADSKTIINLSNHLYFIFNNDLNLNKYYLKMNAPKYGVVDKTILITGVEDVPDYLDFTKGANLRIKMNKVEENSFLGTIDNTFIFDNSKIKYGKVILRNDKTQLTLKTDYPAMNIYVDNSLRDFVFKNNPGNNKRRGIALEPQLFLLDRDSITFDQDKKYKFTNTYTFKKLEGKDE